MTAEVAVQQLRGIRDQLIAEAESLDDWLASAQLPEIDWQNLEQRLAWADYARVLDIILEKRSSEWILQRGAASIYDVDAELFRGGMLLGFDEPGPALEWMCAPTGPFAAVSPFLDNQLRKSAAGIYELRSVMRDGLAPCRSHHLFSQGVLREFPRVLFEKRARVEVEWLEDGANYAIRFAAPSQLLGRIRRRLRRSHAQPDYLAGVGATYLSLVERQIELQAQQALVQQAEAAALRAEKQESLGFLTSGVAHDFRNLLTVAQGQLELLQGEVDDRLSARLAEVLETCRRGAELTDRLLAYAREAPSTPEDINVQEVLASVLPILEKGLGRNGDLYVDIPAQPQNIHVERGQLENALLNLVVNAGDAMQGSGSVKITSEEAEVSLDSYLAAECQPGEYVRISVEDDGSGIDPELAKHVFDPYFTTKATGTGLGLSSVWGFVKQNGGHVTLSPTEDTGCRFDLYLPRR